MKLEDKFFGVIKYVGILAPVPTAYLIGKSVYNHLAWNIVIAWIAAIIIEAIGFGAVHIFTLFREYNNTKRKTDPEAPVQYAVWLIIAYLSSALLLTLVLDVFPKVSIYAPAIFPFMSIVGMAITALHSDHNHRLARIDEEKQERKEKRNAPLQSIDKPKESAIPLDTKGKILAFYRDNPYGKKSDAARVAQVSRQRVGQLLESMQADGTIHVNGNGVEVKE